MRPNIFNVKSKLLITGLFMPGCGLTNVMTALTRHLSETYQVHGLGFCPDTAAGSYDRVICGCPFRICASKMPVFRPEPNWLDAYLSSSGTDAILVIGPAFIVEKLLRQLQKYTSQVRILLYLPVEGKLVDAGILPILSLADHCVMYTQFSYNNVVELCDSNGTQPGFKTTELSVIGHGLDLSKFFPYRGLPAFEKQKEARNEVRKMLFPDRPGLLNAFIVLNANRNYYRKRLDISIEGFSIFAKGKPDVFLYLHTGALSYAEKAKLEKLISNSEVKDQILLNTLTPEGGNLPVERLNLLYNMCDAGLSTSMGEGWGLTAFEHAATGAPQIVPDHTGFRENWLGSAVLVPPVEAEYVFYEYAEMFAVSPDGVAFALQSLYADPGYYEHMANAAFLRTKDAGLCWASVGEKFMDVLESLLKQESASIYRAVK